MKNIEVQTFWYHSPVRFYRTLEEHRDMTNPQNTQYFGEKNPYPLEMGVYHSFPIPMFNNVIRGGTKYIELVNGNERVTIGQMYMQGNRLDYVVFKCDRPLTGRIEIRGVDDNDEVVTFFYSSCVTFLNSTDSEGRKFIRVATRHSYNRHLFNFENENCWLITNLPAYCLGDVRIDAEISNNRVGGNSTLKIRDSFIDEVVTYHFRAGGDANILNFIQVHATNNDFYIDGTKRTCVDKLEREDFAMSGKISFVNIKDNLGYNVLFDERTIIRRIT